MNVENLTAKHIMAVPLDQPEKLYTGEEKVCKMEYHILAAKWHPDRKSGNSDVFVHVKLLYEKAMDRIADGVWATPGLLKVTDIRGRVYQVRYKKKRDFELGECYIGERIVVYAIRKEFSDLVDNATKMMNNFKYANTDMHGEVSRYLPKLNDTLELPDRILVVLQKDPDHLCLRDIVKAFGGKMDVKQVAWIMSRLHNLMCYFDYAGIAHNDISLDTYYISLSSHVGSLVGGWWYAARVGDKMRALPERTIRYVQPDLVSAKKATILVDAELIRAVGRECLGDPYGNKLLLDKSVPAGIVSWLQSPGSNNAFEDYSTWYEKVLPKALGARRFVQVSVPAGIYD